MFRRSVLFAALLMELTMTTMTPLTSSAHHWINNIDTQKVPVNDGE